MEAVLCILRPVDAATKAGRALSVDFWWHAVELSAALGSRRIHGAGGAIEGLADEDLCAEVGSAVTGNFAAALMQAR